MTPAGNKSLRLSKASHVEYKYLPIYRKIFKFRIDRKDSSLNLLFVPSNDFICQVARSTVSFK